MPDLADTLVANESDRLEQAEALVRSYCGWHIAPERTETLTLAGSGGCSLILPSLYVVEIVSVTYDGEEVDAADYELRPGGNLTRLYASWSETVEVELVHGYTYPPPDVTAVVQAIAQRAIDSPSGATSWTSGPFSESNDPEGLTPIDRLTLALYRLPSRP